jgi:hypothetical protein
VFWVAGEKTHEVVKPMSKDRRPINPAWLEGVHKEAVDHFVVPGCSEIISGGNSEIPHGPGVFPLGDREAWELVSKSSFGDVEAQEDFSPVSDEEVLSVLRRIAQIEEEELAEENASKGSYSLESWISDTDDAQELMRVGRSYARDACPQRAMECFEAAKSMGHPEAAQEIQALLTGLPPERSRAETQADSGQHVRVVSEFEQHVRVASEAEYFVVNGEPGHAKFLMEKHLARDILNS